MFPFARSLTRPVNVSSVPQRSLFRYPGGKTWLIPQVRLWLGSMSAMPKTLVEPFVGGGIVSLTAVAEGWVESAHLVELDPDVAAVWKVLCDGSGPYLAEMIQDFLPTLDSVVALLETEPQTVLERAFVTIVRNRTFHGGILAPGSSPMKTGENGKGIGSRWYPETLTNRIMAIHGYRERLTFEEGDAFSSLKRFKKQKSAVFFVDPPYTAAGKKAGRRLYRHNQLDHDRLFDVCKSLSGDVLLTYDNADGVLELVTRFGFDHQAVAMRNTHNAQMNELLIGNNLSWARSG